MCIRFRDVWPTPQVATATMTYQHMTEVESLLEPFKVLRRIEQMQIELPAYRAIDSESELSAPWLTIVADDNHTMTEETCMKVSLKGARYLCNTVESR